MSNKRFVSLSEKELSLFCYQFSVVLKSGIPYVEAIHLLAEEVLDSNLKKYASDIAARIQSGERLYLAFKAQEVFPVYMIEMVHIAEETGRLAEIFDSLSSYYEQSDLVKSKVKSALTYPIVLIGLMTAVILLLVLRILPIFHDILLSVGGDIPTQTQVILNLSEMLQNSLWLIGVLTLGLVVFCVAYYKMPMFKMSRDRFLLRAPIAGKLYRQMIMVKFASAYAMLIRSGMDAYKALELIEPLVENTEIAKRIRKSLDDIAEGVDLEVAFKNMNIFTDLFLKMMQVGIKSGAVEETLEKTAEVYSKELERSLKRLTASIEPTLVIVLSVIVGAIMLLVMLPLIEIMSSIG